MFSARHDTSKQGTPTSKASRLGPRSSAPSSLDPVERLALREKAMNMLRDACAVGLRPYYAENTGSHPNPEVKLHQARLVLGWGTTLEPRVLQAFCLLLLDHSIYSKAHRSKAHRILRFTLYPTTLLPYYPIPYYPTTLYLYSATSSESLPSDCRVLNRTSITPSAY